MNQKDIEKKAKAYALKNALAYDGKAQVGSVISSLFHEGLEKKDIGKYSKIINEIVSKVNKLSKEEQEKEFEKLKEETSERKSREGLEELPNVKKSGVIMRFAPSPSGALHIGHAITASLSWDYVMKYGGRFYVRIEDTNSENIYTPAYKLIEEDAKWLFDNKAKIITQSERMKLYYKYALKLIKKGWAYVCTCSSDDFREKYANNKKDCPCRNLAPKENEIRWNKMLNPEKNKKDSFNEGDAVLRFKTSDEDHGMAHPNPAMRDFPLARINLMKHPLQKNKYRVWPLMNLAVTVDDIEMKMTHIIRAKEHRDNAKRQEMIYKALDKKEEFPWTGFLGRIHLKDMKLSSTVITKGIKEKKYSGWDDKKLLTVASLKKQGYTPKAFWKLAEHIGLSENDKTLSKKEFFELLDTFNKK